MKIISFTDEQEWLDARKTKITGSKLKDIVNLRGKVKKIGFYELIADRMSIQTDEDPMERGHRLEQEAIEKFEAETKKTVITELVMWQRDDNESIAISPDGYIRNNGKITEAVEVKCISSARHLQAFLTREVPKDYYFQALQYFIVNNELEKLHFCFYDPRLIAKQFFFFTVDRDQEAVGKYLEYQRNTLETVNEIIQDLTF